MFTNVGNYGEYTATILEEFKLPGNKTHHEWAATKYNDLPTAMMKVCHDCCVAEGDEKLLEQNPDVIIERYHHILTKGGKVKNQKPPSPTDISSLAEAPAPVLFCIIAWVRPAQSFLTLN